LHNHTSPVKGFEHFGVGHLPVEVLADEISGVNYNSNNCEWMDGKLIIEAWW
jgi:hypothetical protein